MGHKDTFMKQYLRQNAVFADLVNTALFRGKSRLYPQNLREMDTSSEAIVVTDANAVSGTISLTRDIFKEVTWRTDSGETKVYIGIENQSAIDYAMPLRVDLSNGTFLIRNVREIQTELLSTGRVRERITSIPKGTTIPTVITIVVYWGEKPWDGPLSLRAMCAPGDQEILSLIPNTPIVIIEPRKLRKAWVNRMQTDLRGVFMCMRCSHDAKALNQLVQRSPLFKKFDILAGLIIKEVLNINLRIDETKKEGKFNMCQAWKDLLQEQWDNAVQSVEPQLKLLKDDNDAMKTRVESVENELVLIKSENESIKSENESIKSENESLKAGAELARQKLRNQGWSEEDIRNLFGGKA